MSLSAIILAGGQSRRMGRDKAWLEVDGQSLLARQIALVRSIGAAEVFVSGRVGVDYSAMGCPVVTDEFPDAGPLAGIERGLASMTTSRLLVLAVDLPAMTGEFLRFLVSESSDTVGVVPSVEGRWEPLAAIYPRAAHAVVLAQLRQGNFRAQAFVDALHAQGLVKSWTLTAEPAVEALRNWNEPEALG